MIYWYTNLPVFGKVSLVFLGLILLIFFLAILYFGIRRLVGWQTPKNIKDDNDQITLKDRISLKIEIIKTVASILGGMFFILTIVVAFLNYRVTQEKHTTDLFTKAIEQLGDKKMEVRLGGIYALERISRDSEKDHWPIMEVLTAYIRERAQCEDEEIVYERITKEQKEDKNASKQTLSNKKKEDKEAGHLRVVSSESYKPKTDVQAILTVIGRRNRAYGKGEDRRLNLEKTDLRVANLIKSHLEGANLSWSILDLADLHKAHLEEANLLGARLYEANLKGSSLERVNLEQANLEWVELGEANLERANLHAANLKWASLGGARLEGAMLQWADFRNAVNLTEDQVILARCWPLAFYDANFLEALGLPLNHNELLENGDLSGYNFNGVDLTDARLEGTNLQLADFRGVKKLKKEQVIPSRCWQLAFFDKRLLQELGLPPDHNKRLRRRDLSDYNLEGSDLREAQLNGFNLQQANLNGAHLERADLRGVTGLTHKQINEAYCDEKTKLPQGLKPSGKKEPWP